MGEIRHLQPEGHITNFDLKRDLVKNTTDQAKLKLLEIKTANEWIEEAKSKPIPLELLGCLWYQGELAILFADTNLGKSVFAVQIADALTKNKEVEPFRKCSKSFKTLYCDFEMSDKQFENRYSEDYKCHYQFSTNFFRAELNLDEFLLKNDLPIEEQIGDEIVKYITQNDVDIVIIDNLTYIVREIEKSKNIAPLMQKLKLINKQYGTSILVLAHTPKRDMTRPLTNSDIAGSKFLANFADSIFAIGKSGVDETLRYLKQIKSRNSGYLYGSENVGIFRIEKDANFLSFKYQGTDNEENHLHVRTKAEIAELEQQILEEHANNPELSSRKIAEKLGTYHTKVNRVIERNSNM